MDSSIHSFSQSISVQYQYRGTGVYQLFIYLSTYPFSTYLVHQLDEISRSQALPIILHVALQSDSEAIHSLNTLFGNVCKTPGTVLKTGCTAENKTSKLPALSKNLCSNEGNKLTRNYNYIYKIM